MKADPLLPLISIPTEDLATESRKLALAQLREPLPQTSLNWSFLVKQCDRFCQFLIRFIEISHEPKVTWKYDRQGRSRFEIYDPLTEKYHYFNSAQDAVTWLDRDRFGNENCVRRR